jgi:PAS domain S-box-containing protein
MTAPDSESGSVPSDVPDAPTAPADPLSERLRLAMAAGRLGVWERDIASGQVIWTEEVFALFGVDAHRAPDSFDEFTARVHPEDRPAIHAFRARIQTASAAAETRMRVRVHAPTGDQYRHFVATAQRVNRNGREVVIGVMQDVHERTLMEHAARRTAARLSAAATATGIGLWDWDIAANDVQCDAQTRRLLGAPAHDGGHTYEQFRDLVLPEDRVGVEEALGAALHGEAPFETEFRVRWPSGAVRTIAGRGVVERDEAGNAVRVLGVNWDVTERRAAEAAGRAARERLALTAQFAGIGFWRWDAAADRFEFDDRCRTLLGRSHAPRECATTEWQRWLRAEDAAGALAALRGALTASAPVTSDYRVLHADGREVRLSWRGEIQRNAVGAAVGIIGLCWDSTEQYEAQRAQRAALERLSIVMDTVQLGVWEIALADRSTTWDAGMYRIYGVAPGDPTPATQLFERALLAEDRAIVQAQERELLARGKAFNVEFRIRRPDGALRFILSHANAAAGADGKPARIVGVNIDVTERVQEAAAARALTDRLQLATGAAGIGTWELTLDTQTLVWDAQMYRLYGAAAEAGAGTHAPAALLRSSLHPEDRTQVDAAHARAVRTGEPFEYEFRLRWADGSTRWLAGRGRVQRGADGRAAHLVGVNWDVTDRKLAEDAVRARETAERANRAKNEFLARMSHELRTPLNAILGFAQLLERDGTDPPSPGQRERAAQIRRAGQHLLKLVDDVLDLARIEAGTASIAMEPVSVDELAREALDIVAADAKARGVHCALRRAPQAAHHVWADRTRLRQVLLNLLAHAVRVSPAGETVELGIDADADAGGGPATAPAAAVTLSVCDRGPAFTHAEVERVFQPFHRPAYDLMDGESASMGLAIARRLVQQMSGTLEFLGATDGASDSNSRHGNTFVVALRAARVESAAAPAFDADQSGASLLPREDVTGTVLYIEDNPANSLLVEQFLQLRPKVKLFSAPDGATGLVLAAVCQPDVVLIDLKLPDMDGVAVLDALRRQWETRHITCVAVSAIAVESDIAEARRAGFADYWVKPLSVHRFLGDLDRQLALAHSAPARTAPPQVHAS